MSSGCSVPRLLLACALAAGLAGCAPDVVCAPEGRLCTAAGVLGVSGYNGDDLATHSWLYFPSALDFDDQGRLVFADFNNMRIRRVGDDGVLETVVGTGQHAYAIPDAPALETPLENPVDVCWGPNGEPWLAELHAARVLTLDTAGKVVVAAGDGEIGYAGDDGPAVDAVLSQAAGLAVAADGTLYISDTDNHVIRRVDPDGTITLLAGTPEQAGFADGVPGAFDSPQRVRLFDGGLLVADTENHAIRWVDLDSGEVSTLVGDGSAGYAGDGGDAAEARLDEPYAAVGQPDGSLLIADSGNNVVRYVDPDGVIVTLVGTGEAGRAGEDKPVREAQLQFPVDVLPDGDGGIYIADMLNSAVRHAAAVLPPEATGR